MVAIDGTRGHVFVSNFDLANVAVIDEQTLAVVATLSTGGLDLAVDGSHARLYSTNGIALGVYDLNTLNVISIVPSNGRGNWWGVAVNTATQRVYLEDLDGLGSYAVSVMDANTFDVLARVPISGESRFGVTVDEGRNLVYVPNYASSGSLSVIDGATNQIVSTTAVGSFPFDLLMNGDRLYTANLGGGTVSVLTTGTNPMNIETVNLGGAPAGLAFSATARLYVTDSANARVDIVAFPPPPNNAPVVDSVSLSPAQPRTNDVVTATVVAHDADGDPLTYTYQWVKNGADIPGATSATLDLSQPGNGDHGDAIAVRVIAHDAASASAAVTSSAVTVANTPPSATVTLNTTTPSTRTTLVATVTTTDPDADAIQLTYIWRVNGEIHQTITTYATTDSFDLSKPDNGNKGDVITLEVTPFDGLAGGAPATASATVVKGG